MKVLIADDNADHVLQRAEDILPITRSFSPDVCLLDIGMRRRPS